MGKFTITIEVGGDAGRLRRAAEEIFTLIEDTGYLVAEYDVVEEDDENE